MNIAAIIEALQPLLSDDELSEFGRLAMAIEHAIAVAGGMPTTLDPRARALIVTKLQEAEHWSIELLRVAARPRSDPPQ